MTAPDSAPLQIGLHYAPTDTSMPVVDLAQAAADRGFDAIVLPEHTHIPVASQYPSGDGQVPDRYRRILSPYISLAFVAASCNLNVGTCVSLVAQHDPVVLAKTIATLDYLSGGRFTLGVGYGWNRHELANHGKAFQHRRALTREHVALMRALWADDEAEFHGEHVSLSPSWSWPKPVQRPAVPVLLGCSPTPRGFDDAASWADGWMPVCQDPVMLGEWLPALNERWKAARRDRPPVVWVLHFGDALADSKLRSNLAHFRDTAVAQVMLDIPTGTRDELLPILDRYARLMAESATR
jgi:probable F420-dependent oxidoreductase